MSEYKFNTDVFKDPTNHKQRKCYTKRRIEQLKGALGGYKKNTYNKIQNDMKYLEVKIIKLEIKQY